jgi:pimeloyl-ACP methyl ester carboxylesterase
MDPRRCVAAILRPMRSSYDESSVPETLGEESEIRREPFVVKTPAGHEMPASLYRSAHPAPGNPVVIFSHGNAMDQTAAFGFVPADGLVQMGIAFCAFDFAGCGKGTAPQITMGFREKAELSAVVDHLRREFGFEKIVLWGLSMGAFTTVLTLAERTDIAGGICDAPLDSLPSWVRKLLGGEDRYSEVREIIQNEAGFDIEDADGVKVGARVKTPVLFLQGIRDVVVLPEMSKRLFEAVGSEDKQYLTFGGGHVNFRPAAISTAEFEFIRRVLGIAP